MPDATRPTSAKILIVDDVAENRELARLALEGEDYQIACAAGGEEALARFEADRPDCVLLDIRMPRLDGFATCERLRDLPGGAETSIIFLTALRDVDNFDRAVAAGADDFLTKPIRPTELVVRVKSQLELKRLDSALRTQVEVVRHQRDDLLRLQLQKERLMSFLVHDMKNPVNSIDLHAQLLARHKDLSPAAAASIASIRNDARQLLQRILDLLDLSKGEEGRLEPRRVEIDLVTLVNDVMEQVDHRARAAGLELQARIQLAPASFQADAGLLRRILENLIDNALRHTPRGGHIEISATGDALAVEIAVSDDGPGIPPELGERIFDRYVQLDQPSSASRRAGRGLGLAFCRAAMQAHGGTIALDARAGGATFRMRFPRGA